MTSRANVGRLKELARLHSTQTSYTDVTGVRRDGSPETLAAILMARGVITRTGDVDDALARRKKELGERPLPPAVVAWSGTRRVVDMNIPIERAESRATVTYRFENGDVLERSVELGRLESRPSNGGFVTKRLPLESKLPAGYHSLEVRAGSFSASTFLMAAPRKAFSPASKKIWGLFAPMYALRSASDTGVGDISALERVVETGRDLGASFVGTLPLLATFLDEKFDPSPYAPVSRLFWNELYIDLDRVPELEMSAEARARMSSEAFLREAGRLRSSPLIDYREVMALHRQVLEELSKSFWAHAPSTRRDAFEQFRKETTDLDAYASFRAASEVHQHGGDEAARRSYHLYVQFVMSEQLHELAERTRAAGAGLYLDFPLGVNSDGFDVAQYADQFVSGMSVGAAPDLSYKRGQDWGFRPLDPEVQREDRYRYLIACFRQQLEYAGILRIDHVMGLHRLYWVPNGFAPDQGAYVRYPAEELYAILSIESHRHQSVIVGEDLGTVPAYIRTDMKRRGLRRLFVLQRQLTHVTVNPPGEILPIMVASLNNHDMVPFAAFWQGLDIEDRLELTLIDAEGAVRDREKRERVRRGWIELLKRDGLLPHDSDPTLGEVAAASMAYLAKSRAEIVLVNLEDLWLETSPQNVPTTTWQRPNWRRRFRLPLEAISSSESIKSQLLTIARLRDQEVSM